jgi:hypothetical protein
MERRETVGRHGETSASAPRPWAEMSKEGQRSYICAAWEQIRDFPPTRCIKCGGPCDDEGDLYCSKSCAIDAERDR